MWGRKVTRRSCVGFARYPSVLVLPYINGGVRLLEHDLYSTAWLEGEYDHAPIYLLVRGGLER